MKTVLSILLLLLASLANAQVSKLDKIFDAYQEAKGVTSIKIGKPMFNMINKLNIGDEEVEQSKPLLTKISSSRILSVEDEVRPKVKEEVKNAFSKIKY